MSKNDLPYSTQTWGYYKNVSGGKLPSVKSDWTTEWIRKLWRHLMCYMKICIHRKYNTLDNDPKPWLSQVISIRKDSVCLEPNIHPLHKSRVPFSTMYGTMQCYAPKWHSRCLPVGRRWHGLAYIHSFVLMIWITVSKSISSNTSGNRRSSWSHLVWWWWCKLWKMSLINIISCTIRRSNIRRNLACRGVPLLWSIVWVTGVLFESPYWAH